MQDIRSLLQKYNVPGPRYTSYPTVPAWVDTVAPNDYSRALQQVSPEDSLSLYFHLPFCENLCHFCGCMQVITKDHSRSAGYVKYLLNELKLVTKNLPRKAQVSQVHFGGGTPNFLQPEELTQIMDAVRDAFLILPEAEIAIEMHPRTSTEAFCRNLTQLGFNRISLGVQDFDPKVQKLINRHQTFEMTRDMVALLRSLGFNSFNFDLIYGLPGQSMSAWKDTLNKVLELKPNRMAVYSYAHVPWVRPVQRTFSESDLPGPEMKIDLFETALETFTQNSYQLIGMDHFALIEDELSVALKNGSIHRNFMGYSTRNDAHQIGLGVSAISYVAGNYFQNIKELKNYEAAVQKSELATHRGFNLSDDDCLRRDVITQIMCNGIIDFKSFEKQWGCSFGDYFKDSLSALTPFVEDDLLLLNEKELRVKGRGSLFLRNMAMVFDAHLSGIQQKAKTPTFSRTV